MQLMQATKKASHARDPKRTESPGNLFIDFNGLWTNFMFSSYGAVLVS